MMRSSIPAVSLLALLISACTTTWPVAVISEKGQVLRGTATAGFGSGSFQVTDGKLTCAGTYDSLELSLTISMAVLCNDGRKGIAIVTRESNGQSGAGRVRLNDGTASDLVFGRAAAAF